MNRAPRRRRVCYVLCYRDPNYTRTGSLLSAISLIDGLEVVIIRNNHRGWLRYLEVPPRLLATRLRFRPDVFVVGFRAHEIFWALYPAMAGKRIIFDEFIDLHDWLVSEHKKLKEGSVIISALDTYMKMVMKLSYRVLTDTKAHANLAVKNYGVSPKKVVAIPISADDEMFKPRTGQSRKSGAFKVLFYGSMLPLHGVNHILDSFKELKKRGRLDNIQLTLAGGRGDKKLADDLKTFIKDNQLQGHITHVPWVESSELPKYITGFDLALGGPFGNTGQARRVITGKTYQLLSIGKATVVGKIEGMEGFRDKYNCLLVDQGSARSIADAIEWAAANRDKLRQLGQNGHRLFQEKFSPLAVSKTLAEIIY